MAGDKRQKSGSPIFGSAFDEFEALLAEDDVKGHNAAGSDDGSVDAASDDDSVDAASDDGSVNSTRPPVRSRPASFVVPPAVATPVALGDGSDSEHEGSEDEGDEHVEDDASQASADDASDLPFTRGLGSQPASPSMRAFAGMTDRGELVAESGDDASDLSSPRRLGSQPASPWMPASAGMTGQDGHSDDSDARSASEQDESVAESDDDAADLSSPRRRGSNDSGAQSASDQDAATSAVPNGLPRRRADTRPPVSRRPAPYVVNTQAPAFAPRGLDLVGDGDGSSLREQATRADAARKEADRLKRSAKIAQTAEQVARAEAERLRRSAAVAQPPEDAARASAERAKQAAQALLAAQAGQQTAAQAAAQAAEPPAVTLNLSRVTPADANDSRSDMANAGRSVFAICSEWMNGAPCQIDGKAVDMKPFFKQTTLLELKKDPALQNAGLQTYFEKLISQKGERASESVLYYAGGERNSFVKCPFIVSRNNVVNVINPTKEDIQHIFEKLFKAQPYKCITVTPDSAPEMVTMVAELLVDVYQAQGFVPSASLQRHPAYLDVVKKRSGPSTAESESESLHGKPQREADLAAGVHERASEADAARPKAGPSASADGSEPAKTAHAAMH